MLFYRKKELSKSSKDVSTLLPEWLKAEIDNENRRLQEMRQEYEKSLNALKVECFLDTDFYLDRNILYLKKAYQNKSFDIFCDKRCDTAENLKELMTKFCTEPVESEKTDQEIQERKEKCLNLLFDDTQFNWLLVERIQGLSEQYYHIKKILSEPLELISQIVNDSQNLLLVMTNNFDKMPIGEEFLPISIWFKYYDQNFEIKQKPFTFILSTLIKQVKIELGSYLLNFQSDFQLSLSDEDLKNLSSQSFTFNLIKFKPNSIINTEENRTETILLDQLNYDQKTIKELNIHHGDIITVESEDLVNQFFDTKVDLNSQKSETCPFKLIKVNVINFLGSENELKSGNIQNCELFIEDTEIVKNVRIIAMTSFETEIAQNQFHLRFLIDQDLDMMGMIQNSSIQDIQTKFFNPLYDDSNVKEIVEPVLEKCAHIEPNLVFLLSLGQAPLKSNGDLILKCCADKCIGDYFVEILTNSSETIGQLTEKICSRLNLDPLKPNDESVYYLRKLDWLGDVESVLNDLKKKCSDMSLKNNQTIQMTKGILIPPDHFKIKIWLCQNVVSLERDEVILNDLIEKKQKNFKFIKEIIVRNEIKLDDLKVLISEVLIESKIESVDFRIRILKSLDKEDWFNKENKFVKRRALIEWHQNLKQLHLAEENDLGIELLDEDDSINQGIVLIDCIRFDLKTRLCSINSFMQISWNINNGATLTSLKESIFKSYLNLEPSEAFRIHIAKRFYEKYQWVVLRDITDTQSQKGKKKKSGNAQSTKSNLRQSPFNMGNGDIIAFTVLDPTDNRTSLTPEDFMSNDDLDFMNKKNITEAEIKRLKREKQSKEQNVNKEVYRRPEVGIKIKIDDFSND